MCHLAHRPRARRRKMSRGPGFALSLGISLVAVLIAVAIMTWAASPIAGSDSAGPTQAREVSDLPPSTLARVLSGVAAEKQPDRIGGAGSNIRESCAEQRVPRYTPLTEPAICWRGFRSRACPAAAPAPRAATPLRHRAAWPRIFVVGCSLPCDPAFMQWRNDTTL